MKRFFLAAGCSLALFSCAFSAEMKEHAPNPKGIRVVPVDPTPEPNQVKTRIQFPKADELKNNTPIKGQIKLQGFPLGVDSDFPRKKEIFNNPKGQSLHVFIDNQPYFALNEALIDALDDFEDYFDQTVMLQIPFTLQPGMHVMRVFPVRSFNESLKGDNCYDMHVFYYRIIKDNPQMILDGPYLTYNEPQGEFTYDKKGAKPILLDFYIHNCELSRDGYKVRLTIDNANQRTLTTWQPYYIYGLKKGVHHIRLELLDAQNKVVPGMFNDIERSIVIH
ncbi:MAG TPA: hypothetical protein VGJ00_07910 [Rhabdochlamydiaceae bacterium]